MCHNLWACVACGSTGPLTADHIVPISKDGRSSEDNLQPLCGACNRRKGNLTLDLRAAAQSFGAWQERLQARASGEAHPIPELYQAVASYVDAYLRLTKRGQGWAQAAWARGEKEAACYNRAATITVLHAVGLRQAVGTLKELWRLFTAGEASDNALAEALVVELRKWLATTGLRRLAAGARRLDRGSG